jgi:hypothetical protein
MAKPRKKHGSPPYFRDGAGRLPDFRYGVLRSTYKGQPNSALSWVEAKLLLSPTGDGQVRASNYASVIPPQAPDRLTDWRTLWSEFEAQKLPDQRDLALLIDVYCPGAPTLHGCWEAVRAWAYQVFAIERRLPVTLIQHDPSRAGLRTDPHVHIIVAARELGPRGFGAFSDLCCDKALIGLHGSWVATKARFGLS